ncbi:hypothetical protein Acid345_3522 [Candidatus Koribacter versatilis Ellin345]|uniref:LamG domain-containing protein n=1 Tax=Koribacter versatilis (strain Ellin345) TaxID=204669 RepID=Q1IKS7_KORVE|nr:hypothetical protein [Candidatus Koribacter versatilis]ABF42523.1 hypothetical protein Acid345_3522 [Candidatus Koribacter versatilis Ellin345]
MKTLFGAVLVFCAALATGAGQSPMPPNPRPAAIVTILQPTAASGVSPIPIVATVNAPVSVLQLYVDGVKSTEVQGTTLNVSLDLPVGAHRIAVQALGFGATSAKSVKTITVTPPPGTTLSNLHESSDWKTCGNCGNPGAKGKVATYSMVRGITTPAINNLSTSSQFNIGGAFPYTNGYWWLEHTAPKSNLKSLVYDFYLYVPSASAKSPQAIEFECQHTLSGYIHNFAWQADYASKKWRTFDYTNNTWVATTIPFTGFAPDTWHHIVAEYHEDGTSSVHDALTIDGVRTAVNITRAATYSGQTWASFTNGFQLDLNGVPTSYAVYVDKMNVNYQ